MAMSKCCFFTILIFILLGIAAAVAVIVVQMQKENVQDEKVTEEVVNVQIDGQGLSEMCAGFATKPTSSTGSSSARKSPEIGITSMGMQSYKDPHSGKTFQKNALWLTGDPDNDRLSLAGIKAQTCKGMIPVIVIRMRPTGLSLSANARAMDHYKPKLFFSTWAEYDKALAKHLSVIANIPSVVIMEPDLFMYAYDQKHQQYRWKNEKYEDEFLLRVQRVVRNMPKSWVYVDAGNAAYLSNSHNMDQMARTMLRMTGIRGFTINSLHYFNTTFNSKIALRLHCKTGLHFLVDTGRNGGKYSRQHAGKILKCLFDPPNVKSGSSPGWSWGVRSDINQYARKRRWTMNDSPASSSPPPVRLTPSAPHRVWPTSRQSGARNYAQPPDPSDTDAYNKYINELNNNKNNEADVLNTHINSANNNQGNILLNNLLTQPPVFPSQPQYGSPPRRYDVEQTNYDYDPNDYVASNNNGLTTRYNTMMTSQPGQMTGSSMLRSASIAGTMFGVFMDKYSTCIRTNAVKVHDGNIWMKTAGEADGRMFPYGSYRTCLIEHNVMCTDTCKLLVEEDESMPPECNCETPQTAAPTFNHDSNSQYNPYSIQQQRNSGGTSQVQPNGYNTGGIFSNQDTNSYQQPFNSGSSSLSDILQAAAGR